MRKYISVDREAIHRNASTGGNAPVLIVEYKEPGCGGAPWKEIRGYEVMWDGPSKLVYRPHNPEGRINSAWVETDAPVEVCTRDDTCDHTHLP